MRRVSMFKRIIIRWLAPVVSEMVQQALDDPKYIKRVKASLQQAEGLRQLNENEAYMASLKKVPK